MNALPTLSVAAPVLLVIGVAQHAARQIAGVLALFVEHLAVDDRGEDALGRFLDAPAGPARCGGRRCAFPPYSSLKRKHREMAGSSPAISS
jgi:hypothetical protein